MSVRHNKMLYVSVCNTGHVKHGTTHVNVPTNKSDISHQMAVSKRLRLSKLFYQVLSIKRSTFSVSKGFVQPRKLQFFRPLESVRKREFDGDWWACHTQNLVLHTNHVYTHTNAKLGNYLVHVLLLVAYIVKFQSARNSSVAQLIIVYLNFLKSHYFLFILHAKIENLSIILWDY